MTTFAFTETVPYQTIESAALGTGSGTWTKTEIGKAVKLGSANNFVFCTDGDAIDGFVNSVDAITVNGGYGFGGVQTDGRRVVQVATGATLAVGDLVIAAAQTALGTAGYAQVKKQATPAAGIKYWKVIAIKSGTGAAGDLVLVQEYP